MNEVAAEMPKYQCHKIVWALKISGVSPQDGTGCAELFFENKKYSPLKVDMVYLAKHQPVVGGYYVVYPDGYKSFSPADAFEDGYSLLP